MTSTVAVISADHPDQDEHRQVARHLGQHGLQRRRRPRPASGRVPWPRPGTPAAAPSRRSRTSRPAAPAPARRPAASPSAASPRPVWPSGRQELSSLSCRPNIVGVLLGLGVVVAEQVQDAVRAQQVDLVLDARARPAWPGPRPPAGRSPRRRAGRGSRAARWRRGRRGCRRAAAAGARPWGTRARRSAPARPSSARAARSWPARPPAGPTARPAGAPACRPGRAGPARPARPRRRRRRTRWRSRCSLCRHFRCLSSRTPPGPV